MIPWQQEAERLCQEHGVTLDEALVHSRKPKLVKARQAVAVMLREERHLSYPQIARLMKRKDHTTVIYWCSPEMRARHRELYALSKEAS